MFVMYYEYSVTRDGVTDVFTSAHSVYHLCSDFLFVFQQFTLMATFSYYRPYKICLPPASVEIISVHHAICSVSRITSLH